MSSGTISRRRKEKNASPRPKSTLPPLPPAPLSGAAGSAVIFPPALYSRILGFLDFSSLLQAMAVCRLLRRLGKRLLKSRLDAFLLSCSAGLHASFVIERSVLRTGWVELWVRYQLLAAVRRCRDELACDAGAWAKGTEVRVLGDGAAGLGGGERRVLVAVGGVARVLPAAALAGHRWRVPRALYRRSGGPAGVAVVRHAYLAMREGELTVSQGEPVVVEKRGTAGCLVRAIGRRAPAVVGRVPLNCLDTHVVVARALADYLPPRDAELPLARGEPLAIVARAPDAVGFLVACKSTYAVGLVHHKLITPDYKFIL